MDFIVIAFYEYYVDGDITVIFQVKLNSLEFLKNEVLYK
jgi:hypothetical protein